MASLSNFQGWVGLLLSSELKRTREAIQMYPRAIMTGGNEEGEEERLLPQLHNHTGDGGVSATLGAQQCHPTSKHGTLVYEHLNSFLKKGSCVNCPPGHFFFREI